LAALSPLALLLADCVVGPQYKRPELATPQQFRLQLSPAEAASFADLPFWSVFNDPVLDDLIKEGLAHNYDLQVAVARIEQARNLVGEAASEGKPQVGYQAFGGYQQTPVIQHDSVGNVGFGTIGGLINAAWELDVWGRIRHSTAAAQARLLAQEDVRRGVILTLVSDIAANYFTLIALDRQLAVAQDSSGAYGKTLDLFTDRFKAGKDSELPVQRTQAAFDSSSARIADLKRQIAQEEDAISVLVGAYPRDIARGRLLTEQSAPATPLGATTDILRRRPDIQQAEHTMMAANEDIGVAVANFYPRVGLSALFGGQGVGLSNTFAGVSLANVLADVAGPITTGGRLHSIYHERQAFWDETVATYKKTVLGAFRETSDALAAQQNLVKQREGLESQTKALQQSVDLALLRYDGGRASYFEVLEAQQELYPAQDALAQTQRDQLLAVVSLYKALGGGWTGSDAQGVAKAEAAPSAQKSAEAGKG
jgi:multidrug efflux system outer membrane protein